MKIFIFILICLLYIFQWMMLSILISIFYYFLKFGICMIQLSPVVYFLLKRLSSCFCGSIQSTCCNHWHLYKSTCLCSFITRRTLNNCNCLLLQYLFQRSTQIQIQIETQRNAEGNNRIRMLYFDDGVY